MSKKIKGDSKIMMICGHPVTVNYINGLPNNDGEWCPNTNTINIELSSDRPVEQLLLHEIIHSILEYTGLTNLLDKNIEEAIVSGIEYNLIPHITFKEPDA
jgi:hypothetical protein